MSGTYEAAEAKRREFLELLYQGLRPPEACEQMGIKLNTYKAWRSRDAFFAAECDSRTSGARKFKDEATATWESFVDFRFKFFGHVTPPHQAMIINAMEATKPGDVTMILVPPEHGKTTIFEDWACFKLSLDPEWRFMVGCEAISLSTRILGRIKNRMDPKGPMRKWVEQFGPFAPQMATGQATRQTWAGTHFNVYKRTEFDERDYSMSAIGFGSNIIGSRTDHLHCDDLQSKKTINKTELMVETFQQDWLTRPGESGITTINGTRAGDGDFYEGLMTLWEGQPWFRIVKLPAIVTDHVTGEKKPLWEYNPEMKSKNKGYTMEQLEKIKSKVGEEVWARSYMQNPRAQGLGTFIDDIIERCFNYERELYGPLPLDYAPIYIGLDPALGGVNCLMAWQITSEKMYLVDVQKAVNLQRNEDIMLQLELMLNRLKQRGGRVTEVVVETMNFQRGLARMDKFKELSEKWGFSTREHLTGNNKYSEDIGVASMPSDFIERRIDIPYAPEAFTREVAHRFRDELLRWRPGIKGSLLRQDEVMATWFVWIKWQERRRSDVDSMNTKFQAAGLPWAPTETGLLIPSGRSPFYGGR